MKQTRVGIVNVTGYAGIELARLLSQHPQVKLTSVTGRSAAGQKLGKVFPHMADLDLTIEAKLGKVDFTFSALPHKESAQEIIPLLEQGVKVVDISADFRLKDATNYPAWYDFTHPAPELLEKAVFGLPELHRSQITEAQLVANPGCYPTGAILALAPAVKANIIGPDIIVDSKSGISGAGRSLGLNVHYSEANEDVSAYALGGHRHQPEITQELEMLCHDPLLSVTFIPHLIPMTRGIQTTAYGDVIPGKLSNGEKGKGELLELYRDFYKDMPFTRVIDSSPHTKHTWGSNMCYVYPTLNASGQKLVTLSAIDNLVKGAAGQAIHNMNLMLGFPENSGLEAAAVFP